MILIEVIILILLLILLILAIVWEAQDKGRVLNLTPIYDMEDEEQIQQACTEYACYPAEQGISWRVIYISTFIASLIVMVILYYFNVLISWPMFFLIFAAVFFTVYLIDHLILFHFYKEICYSAQFDKPIKRNRK